MLALTRCPIGSKFQRTWKKKEKSRHPHRKNSSQSSTKDGEHASELSQLCVRINTLHQMLTEIDDLEKRMVIHLKNSESVHEGDLKNGLCKKFELAPVACVEGILQISETVAYKIIFHDLSHVLWDGLYVGEPSTSRIEHFIREIEQSLLIISDKVHEGVRIQMATDIMKASFDGFLLVLLGGGPSRAFSKQDSKILEDDFIALEDFFLANGDGLPADLVDEYSATIRSVLPLFKADTESLIEWFKHVTVETYGSSARLPLPETSGQWNPTEPDTLLRVLCYRNDEAASKFLKKTFNLPKRL